jgi:hypothetical protein
MVGTLHKSQTLFIVCRGVLEEEQGYASSDEEGGLQGGIKGQHTRVHEMVLHLNCELCSHNAGTTQPPP